MHAGVVGAILAAVQVGTLKVHVLARAAGAVMHVGAWVSMAVPALNDVQIDIVVP
jgi:hypothetical protein